MIKRLFCWLGSHDWGWQVLKLDYTLGGMIVNTEWSSLRTCKKCGKHERFSEDLGWIRVTFEETE